MQTRRVGQSLALQGQLGLLAGQQMRRLADTRGSTVQPLAAGIDLAVNGALQPQPDKLQRPQPNVLRLGAEFGGSSRCGRARIGAKISDGEVGFMANAADGLYGCGYL
jgi:hypothetical protein